MTVLDNDRGDDGYVVLDSKRMEELRLREGVSRRQFAELAETSPTTAYRFFKEERIQIQTAKRLFENLGIEDFRPYLVRRLLDSADDGRPFSTPELAEWNVESMTTKPLELSNGLQFRLCKLSHSLLPNTFARGKCYDLRLLATRDRQKTETQLLRHPTVCRKLENHPRFMTNERVLYSEDRSRFWVIDRWYDGITLADKLRYGALTGSLLPQLMLQLLEGLAALHEHGIIRRELSPRYVLLSEPTCDALFTELELAKLLEGAISVSETWDNDPFRAPEIENDEITPSVDLYSWAQTLVHAATGRLPQSPAQTGELVGSAVPSKVCSIADRCLSLSYKFRPTLRQVQQVVEGWAR